MAHKGGRPGGHSVSRQGRERAWSESRQGRAQNRVSKGKVACVHKSPPSGGRRRPRQEWCHGRRRRRRPAVYRWRRGGGAGRSAGVRGTGSGGPLERGHLCLAAAASCAHRRRYRHQGLRYHRGGTLATVAHRKGGLRRCDWSSLAASSCTAAAAGGPWVSRGQARAAAGLPTGHARTARSLGCPKCNSGGRQAIARSTAEGIAQRGQRAQHTQRSTMHLVRLYLHGRSVGLAGAAGGFAHVLLLLLHLLARLPQPRHIGHVGVLPLPNQACRRDRAAEVEQVG